MTVPLPDPKVDQQAWELERAGVQRNFEALARLVVDTGGRSIRLRYGVADVTWPGANQQSTAMTITHGLDTTPVVVLCTLQTGGGANYPVVKAFSYTATTFQLQLNTVDASTPANTVTSTVAWAAIG